MFFRLRNPNVRYFELFGGGFEKFTSDLIILKNHTFSGKKSINSV